MDLHTPYTLFGYAGAGKREDEIALCALMTRKKQLVNKGLEVDRSRIDIDRFSIVFLSSCCSEYCACESKIYLSEKMEEYDSYA